MATNSATYRKALDGMKPGGNGTVADARTVIGTVLVDIHDLFGQVEKLSDFSSLKYGKEVTNTQLNGQRLILEQIYNSNLKGLAASDRMQQWLSDKIRSAVDKVYRVGSDIGDASSEGLVEFLGRNVTAAATETAAAVKTAAKAEVKVVKKAAQVTLETAGELATAGVGSIFAGLWPVLLIVGVGAYFVLRSPTARAAARHAAGIP